MPAALDELWQVVDLWKTRHDREPLEAPSLFDDPSDDEEDD